MSNIEFVRTNVNTSVVDQLIELTATQNVTFTGCTLSALSDITGDSFMVMVAVIAPNIYIEDTNASHVATKHSVMVLDATGGSVLVLNCNFADLLQRALTMSVRNATVLVNGTTIDSCNTYLDFEGGGFRLDANQSQVVIAQSIFKNNLNAGRSGGGASVVVNETQFNMTDCEFYNNTAPFSGGMYLITVTSGSTFLIRNTFHFNSATNGSLGIGGGFEVLLNYTTRDSQTLEIQDCTIDSNHALVGGGIGFGVSQPATVIIYNTTFHNNTSTSGAGLFSAFPITLNNSRFLNNTAANFGAGMTLAWADTNPGTILLESCYFGGNIVLGGVGAAISALLGGTPTIEIHNSIFEYNQQSGSPDEESGKGGGMVFGAILGYFRMYNTTFSHNVGQYEDAVDFHVAALAESMVFENVVAATSCFIEVGNAQLYNSTQFTSIESPKLSLFIKGELIQVDIGENFTIPGSVLVVTPIFRISVPDLNNTSAQNVSVMTFDSFQGNFSSVELVDATGKKCTPANSQLTQTAFYVTLQCQQEGGPEVTPEAAGLTGGAIAGIVVGCVVFAAILVALFVLLHPPTRQKIFPHRQSDRDTVHQSTRNATPVKPVELEAPPSPSGWNRATPSV